MGSKRDDIVSKNFDKFEEVVSELESYFDSSIVVSFELGRTFMSIDELINLEPGYIVDLKKSAGENLDIFINNQLAMKGEVAIIEDSFNIRITEIIDPDRKI